MFLMMAEVLQLSRVAAAYPGNWFWSILGYNQTHVAWAGASLHDLIQPSFSFLVGVALPYSIASRMGKGGTFGKMFAHALWRSLILVALGVFLRSTHSPQTNFTFEDTLSQIGFGYPFLFLLGFVRPRWQWTAFGVILFGYWLAWALYPVPGADFNYQAVGVPPDWQHHYTGFMAHWNKNSNAGSAFDQFSEPVSTTETVCGKQWRIPDPQLYSYTWHDDPRFDRRTLASLFRAGDSVPKATPCRCRDNDRRCVVARFRDLPHREANLDT